MIRVNDFASEMTYIVSSGALNSTHSLTQSKRLAYSALVALLNPGSYWKLFDHHFGFSIILFAYLPKTAFWKIGKS